MLHTSAAMPQSLSQQFGGGEHLAQDGPRAEQLHAVLGLLRTRPQQVAALDDALLVARAQARVRVVLVHQGQVEVDVLLLLHHPLQAVVDDHRQFVRVSRVVRHAVRDRRRQHVAVAVFVLQALAVERRAPGGAAEQEAARLHVAGRPGEVADALEAEHRVVDVERDHDAVVGRVRRRGRQPRAERARLVDALLQDLPGGILAVVHHLVLVDRRVLLALGRVDAELPEHALEAEGARLVGHDRHHPRPERLVADQRGQHAHERLRGRDLAPLGSRLEHRLEQRPDRAPAATRSTLRRRCGSEPPSARRRSIMYCISGVVGSRPVERELAELARPESGC